MSMITEQTKELRERAKGCQAIGDFVTAEIFREAADTIEVYKKAFEDIRAELIKTSKICEPEYKDAFEVAVQIIDKHDPSKAGKE